MACLAIGGGITSLSACSQSKTITGIISGSDLSFQASEFKIIRKDKVKYRKYIIAHNPKLRYPICIYRMDNGSYKAILMRCTHQGAELQAFGDKLQCPAHGSEFNKEGRVMNMPADKDLRTFPVRVEKDFIKISLT